MEIARYLLGILPWEAVKDWLKSKGIPVSLAIAAILVVFLLGWCSAESSRKKLSSSCGVVHKLWLRLLALALRGPQVTIDYTDDCDSRDVPFKLRNHSDRTAFRIHIVDIRHILHVASFDEVSEAIRGEPVEIYCNLSVQGSLLTAFRHRFCLRLRSNEEQVASFRSPILRLPVYIEYVDVHNRPFETECEISYNYFSRKATTTFKKWGKRGTIQRGESIPPAPYHAEI